MTSNLDDDITNNTESNNVEETSTSAEFEAHQNVESKTNHNAENTNTTPPHNLTTRRSCRISKPLSYLQDFHCSFLSNQPLLSKLKFPLQKYLNYDKLSQSHK